jgi:hypothetical protein
MLELSVKRERGCRPGGFLGIGDSRSRNSGRYPLGLMGYQVCSAARTSISLTVTRRSRVTM